MRSHAKASSAGSNTRRAARPRAALLVLVLAAFAVLGLVPAAQAAPSHTELPALSHESGFDSACGVAVDGNGYLYASSQAVFGASSIKVFDMSGALVVSIPVPGCPLEVDANGNIYAAGGGVVTRYVPSNYPPTSGTTYSVDASLNGNGVLVSSSAKALAVDPASGNAYVTRDVSNEKQRLEVKATSNLGGTYKLSFEGQSTGWTGEANLSGASGTADLSAATGTGLLSSGSNVITVSAVSTGAFAVDQIVTVSPATNPALPANTKITSCTPDCTNPTSLTLSASATGTGTGVSKTLTAGSKTISNVTGGPFTVGNSIEGTGINSTIASCAPDCTSPTSIELAARVTAPGIAVPFAAGSKAVTGATTNTGKLSNSEEISGPGIQPGTTISAVNEGAGTFTLSKPPSTTGKVALSADLTFGASNINVKEALEKLSTIGAANVNATGTGSTSPVKREVEFKGPFAGNDQPEMVCDGSGLTGTAAACSIATVNPGSGPAIFVYQPDGTLVSKTTGSGVAGASYYGVDVFGANGRVYAVDSAHNKVLIFASGAPTPMIEIDGSEAPGGPFGSMLFSTLAVDQSNGNVLVSDIQGHGVVDEFDAAGKYVGQITHTPAFTEGLPADIAYDNSATAKKGNVYVTSGTGTGNGKVYAYGPLSPKKTLTTTATPGAQGEVKCYSTTNACLSEYAESSSVELKAVAKPGFVFKEWKSGTGSAESCNGSTNTTCTIKLSANSALTAEFKVPGPSVTTTAGATERTTSSAKVAGTVNPNGKAVTKCEVEYGTSASYGSKQACASLPGSGSSPVEVTASLSGLAAGTTYHFRVVAENADGPGEGADQTFTTKPNAPIVTTTAGATEIAQTTAKVAGTVNPNGGNVTECKVEYGTSASYGSEKACASLPGSGSSPVAVSASLSSLTASTTYHFRVVATNEGGTTNGADQTFTTLVNAPTVVTTAGATEIAQTTAKVAGTVNPNSGNVTTCKVEYGTSASYGSEKACASLPGSGSSPVAVSASLTGLSASTTYHFRVVATNAGGTTNGADQTFATLPNAPSVTSEAASALTKTTATANGTVNPNSGNVTTCKVEYGTSASYGSEKACASLPGSGSSPVAVTASLTGLTANTTYHFRVVATNAGGTTNGSDLEFTTSDKTAPIVTTTAGATEIAQTTAKVAGTVNPNGVSVTECKVEYGTSASYGSEKACASLPPGSGSSPLAVSVSLTGLSPKTTYHFRVVASNGEPATGTGGDQTFETLSNAPSVTTTAGATEIAQTTAKVAGTVNPNEASVTDCHIDYGTSASYGSQKPCALLPGSGSSPVAVSASLSSLTASTTYHFRVVATNAGGTTNGADQTFTTLVNAPSVVTTAGATEIAQTTAKVAGTANPNSGAVSDCHFEYGTTASYGSSAAASPNPGSGSSPVGVSASLTGLSANTAYHFRLACTNPGGTTNGTDQTFTTLVNAPSVVTTAGATEIAQTTAKAAGTVNPNSGNVTECKVEYGTTASYGSEKACASLPGSGSSPVAVSASLTGLTANTTYHFRVVATNAGGTTNGTDLTFATLVNAPTVVTTAGATEISQTTAKVAGTVNPNSGNVTDCHIDYGLTISYGSQKPCASLPGSGTSPVAVEAALTGLSPKLTYHFRVVATNAGGTTNGTDQTFTTLPNAPSVLTTAGATEIAQTAAKVSGTVNPNGGTVSKCEVEYGTTASYGSKKDCASLPGSGSSPVAISASLSGLSASTTYHFRFVATNAGGTTNGTDQTFTTLANTCETDSSLCPPAPTAPSSGSSPAPSPAPVPAPAPKPLKCKKGFKKKTVKGKAKCVKVRKKHRKAHKAGRAS